MRNEASQYLRDLYMHAARQTRYACRIKHMRGFGGAGTQEENTRYASTNCISLFWINSAVR